MKLLLVQLQYFLRFMTVIQMSNDNIVQFAKEDSCSKGSAIETLTAYVHFTVFKNYMYIGQYDIQIEQINCRGSEYNNAGELQAQEWKLNGIW